MPEKTQRFQMFTYLTAKRIIFRFQMCLFIFWYNPSPLVYTGRCQLNSGDRFPHSGHLPGGLLKTKGLWAQSTIFSRMIILQIQNFDQIIKHTAISNFLDCELFDVRLSKTTSILSMKLCFHSITSHHCNGHYFQCSADHNLNIQLRCKNLTPF